MIRMSFDGTDVRVVSMLQAAGPNILAALTRKIDLVDLDLQQYIVTHKLQGQVLHHRTGKGASSVRVVMAHAEGTAIVGGVQAGGGPAWYMRLHEFGGEGPYMILPRDRKALHFFVGGTEVFARRVNHPAILERSFMRSSLDEKREEIIEALRTAMIEGLQRSSEG